MQRHCIGNKKVIDKFFKCGCLVAGVSSRIHYQGIEISVPCFPGIAKLQECQKRDDI